MPHDRFPSTDSIDRTLLALARQDRTIANQRVVELQLAIGALATEVRDLRAEVNRLKAGD